MCQVSQMGPWSRSTVSCHVCKTNYNRMMERMKTNPSLRRYWKALEKPEKQQWFVQNKATYEPNKRKAFDNAAMFVESAGSSARSSEEDMWHYLPLDEWVIRERSLGNCGNGTAEEQRIVAKESFNAALMDKNMRKKKVGEVWLVGVFRGVEHRTGNVEFKQQEFKRQKTVNDMVELQASAELQTSAQLDHAQWLSEQRAAASSHIAQRLQHEAPDDGLVRNPLVHRVDGGGNFEDLKREVIMTTQRDLKIAAEEELDDHQAQEHDKIRKASLVKVGRPKKLVSQVLSDLSRLVRDRALHIKDATDKLKTTAAEAVKEAQVQLKQLLADVVAVVLAPDSWGE